MAPAPRWTAEEDAWLLEHYTDGTNRELSLMMSARGWFRSPGAIATHADKLGVAKGSFPWNKGKDGYHLRKAREAPAHNRLPLLSTFVRSDNGRHMIKVSPRDSVRGNQRKEWINEGIFVWMQANGRDWPDGCDCFYADRDPDNLDPENIVPVPRSLAPLLNGAVKATIPWWDKETLMVAIADARLRHEIYRRERSKP